MNRQLIFKAIVYTKFSSQLFFDHKPCTDKPDFDNCYFKAQFGVKNLSYFLIEVQVFLLHLKIVKQFF